MNNSYNNQHPSIKVIIEQGDAKKKEYRFNDSICIGRDEECDIQLKDGSVSKKHLELSLVKSEWWLSDANSRNGSYINDHKINNEILQNQSRISLGKDGPIINITIESGGKSKIYTHQQDQSVNEYIDHYFGERQNNESIGEHTMMVRQAYEVVKKKHSSKYIKYIIAISIVAVLIGIYAIYQQINTSKQIELAESIFYDMKSIELEISKLNETIIKSGDKELIERISQLKNTHQKMEKRYDEYIDNLDIYDMDEDEKIIVNMAHNFGECELNIPKGFIEEVRNYIDKWKSSNRLKTAIFRAKKNGYDKIIVKKMREQQLPQNFFYLALQESNFINNIIGPKTRYGIAKGIWQFIPKTAIKFGLKLGPLAKLRKYDPRDERFQFKKATTAAAKYLSYIYNTEAQASGLLVMASYNWGEHNVRDLILKLPGNPKDRNFWRLLKSYKKKIPKETYNYVFYIFSAAVICENPALFGFDFENPLSNVMNDI